MPAQETGRELRDAEVMCLTQAGICNLTPSPASGTNTDGHVTYQVFQRGAPEAPHNPSALAAQMQRGAGPFQRAVDEFYESLRESLAAGQVARAMGPPPFSSPGSPDLDNASPLLRTAVATAAAAYVQAAREQGSVLGKGSRPLALAHFELGELLRPALTHFALGRVAEALEAAAARSRREVALGWSKAFVWELNGPKGARLTLFASQPSSAGSDRPSAATVAQLTAATAAAFGGSDTNTILPVSAAVMALTLHRRGGFFFALEFPL
ncbi:MAG: hypothetical protein IPL40_05650 [Proteobacteria bacterium]|nr:hypothetical protein [Pseudomonadota bacterium]